jgi:hypothetical protein
MKQILLEVDDRLAERLEAIAPARSRKRSEFLRRAIQEAIWAMEEEATREAYARQPAPDERSGFDASVWEPEGWKPARARRPQKPRRKR